MEPDGLAFEDKKMKGLRLKGRGKRIQLSALNLKPPTSNLSYFLSCLFLQEGFEEVDGYGEDRRRVLFRGDFGQGLKKPQL